MASDPSTSNQTRSTPASGNAATSRPADGNLLAQGRRQARIMRIVNVPMRAVLSLPDRLAARII